MKQSNDVRTIHLWVGPVLYSKFCGNSDAQILSRTRASERKGKIAQAKLTYQKKNHQTRVVMTLY